jgi:hypothetical protein
MRAPAPCSDATPSRAKRESNPFPSRRPGTAVAGSRSRDAALNRPRRGSGYPGGERQRSRSKGRLEAAMHPLEDLAALPAHGW